MHTLLKVALTPLLLTMIGVGQAAAVSPRQLVEVVDIGQPVVSPDGRSVAYRTEQASIERNTYDSVWYVQDVAGEAAAWRVADGGLPLRDSAGQSLPAIPAWDPGGRWIYYRALIEGRIEVWRAAADGTGARAIASDPADVRDFMLSADGRTLYYSVGASREAILAAEQEEYDRGILIDETAPLGQPLFRSGNIEGRLATQRYGAVWFDRAFLLSDAPLRWRAVDLQTLEMSGLPPSWNPPSKPAATDLLADAWVLAVSNDHGGRALLVRTGEAEGLLLKPDVEMVVLSRDATQVRRCTADLCRGKPISGIVWRPQHDEVLFTVTSPEDGLAQSLFRWNVALDEVNAVASSSGLLGGGRDRHSNCGVSRDAVFCVAADPAQPPRIERIDIETGVSRILFDPNAALRQQTAAVAPRILQWTDANGQSFSAQYYPPANVGDSAPPLFITYYQCAGFVRGGIGDEWPLFSLAQRGIAALCINSAPYRIDASERYGIGMSAVESAIALLSANGSIDPERVGLGGLSFGAEVTMWTLTNSELIAAASVASPVISSMYYLLGSMKGDAFFEGLQSLWQLGPIGSTQEQWQALAPNLNLDRIRAPLLMQVPEQEYLYALDYAVPLIRERKAELHVFPHEPHQKFQPRHKLAAYERNLDWFLFWLHGHEDPAGTKQDQYERWRAMRRVAVGLGKTGPRAPVAPHRASMRARQDGDEDRTWPASLPARSQPAVARPKEPDDVAAGESTGGSTP